MGETVHLETLFSGFSGKRLVGKTWAIVSYKTEDSDSKTSKWELVEFASLNHTEVS